MLDTMDAMILTDNPRFNFQIRMLEKGADELERQIGRLDEVLFKIKASAITVWVAIIGWAMSSQSPQLIPLGFAALVGFWLLEGIFRRVQLRYIQQMKTLSSFLNNTQALDKSFQTYVLPDNCIYSMGFSEGSWQKLKLLLDGLLSTTVFSIYLFLALVNLLVWKAIM